MSGRKNVLNNAPIVTAGAMASNITSSPLSIEFLDNIGIQCNIISGTPSGTFTIQVSADWNNHLQTGNWITLQQPNSSTNVQAVITSGSPANVYFDLSGLSAPWIQLIYTASGGTGSLNAFAVAKAT